MLHNMKRCRNCRRLFDPREQSRLCTRCREERNRHYTGAGGSRGPGKSSLGSVSTVRSLLNALRRNKGMSGVAEKGLLMGPMCKRCKLNKPLKGRQYCLGCHVELHSALGASAASVTKNKAPDQKGKSKAMSVHSAIHQKRLRTGSQRFDPSQ